MLQIDATFIFVFISFLIFIFLMNLVCYKPVMKIIAKREEFYANNKEKASKMLLKKEETENIMHKELQSAKYESSKMLNMTVEKNKMEKERIINNKKTEINESVYKFENELNESAAEAKSKLKGEIETYVKDTVSKVLNMPKEIVYVDASKIDEIIK